MKYTQGILEIAKGNRSMASILADIKEIMKCAKGAHNTLVYVRRVCDDSEYDSLELAILAACPLR
jgi:hypothetical protein